MSTKTTEITELPTLAEQIAMIDAVVLDWMTNGRKTVTTVEAWDAVRGKQKGTFTKERHETTEQLTVAEMALARKMLGLDNTKSK